MKQQQEESKNEIIEVQPFGITEEKNIDIKSFNDQINSINIDKLQRVKVTGTSVPSYTPSSLLEQFYLQNDGSNNILWVNINNTWTKINNTSLAKTIIPHANFTYIDAPVSASGNTGIVLLGQVVIPAPIEVNAISFTVQGHSVNGGVNIGIYSNDGQTKYIDESISVTSDGLKTATLSSSVQLNAGIYYAAVAETGGTFNWYTFDTDVGNPGVPTGKYVIEGSVSTSSGLLPASFDPASDISANSDYTPIIRLDN